MNTGEALLEKSILAPKQGHAKNGIFQTAILIVANCAGAGILSLPKAINSCGLWPGVFLVLGAAILSAYTADILGRCYDICAVEEQEKLLFAPSLLETADQKALAGEEGRSLSSSSTSSTLTAHDNPTADDSRQGPEGDGEPVSFFARSPYAAVGQKAAGKFGALAVTAAQVATQFSVMVLFFLISGVNLNKLIPERSSAFFSLVCTAVLAPLMLLRPGHVWGTAVFAILASIILVVVIVVLCASNAKHDPYTDPPTVTFSSFGTAFGVILFGFGGHAILPALQGAMHNPTPGRFRQAIVWSFATCTGMYLCSSISSVLRLGGTVSDDVLTNFSGAMNDFGLISVTAHLLFAAVTVHIPLGQITDHYAGVTVDFSFLQILIRVLTMALVSFVVWAVGSHFYCVIGLVGGTCNNAMIFIYPPWFYLRLMGPEERTPFTVLKMISIMVIGTAGMVSALNGAVDSCQ